MIYFSVLFLVSFIYKKSCNNNIVKSNIKHNKHVKNVRIVFNKMNNMFNKMLIKHNKMINNYKYLIMKSIKIL